MKTHVNQLNEQQEKKKRTSSIATSLPYLV